MQLLGEGELKSKLNLTVYSATASARAAVEKAGGTLTTTKPEAAGRRGRSLSLRQLAGLAIGAGASYLSGTHESRGSAEWLRPQNNSPPT